MPQKLIRLTSDSGDGVFNGLFNEEISIKENSQIALQSLTLERRAQTIDINSANNIFNFSSVGVNFNQSGEIIPQQGYDKTNNDEFLKSITNGANRVCSMKTENAQMNIQWKVGRDNDAKVSVSAAVSPFYTLDEVGFGTGAASGPTFSILDRSVINNIVGAEVVKAGEEFQVGEAGIWRENDTVQPATNLNESYMWGSYPMIKSTGALRTRFKRLNTSGAGLDTFTMGIVKGSTGLTKLRNSTLELADVEYLIRARGHNTAMQFKAGAAGSLTPTVTPINHTVANTLNKNDVLEIIFDNGQLLGQIHQNDAVGGAGTDIVTTLTSVDVEDGEDYYWFISLHEGKNNCVLDLTNVSLDPFQSPDARLDVQNQRLTTPIEQTALTTVIIYDPDTVLNGSWQFVPPSTNDSTVANFLGFKANTLSPLIYDPKIAATDLNSGTQYELTSGFSWTAGFIYDLGQPQNYIIDTQTFTLDSFDSFGLSADERNAKSGGGRRNILATIPDNGATVAGTANEIIQYQPNTLYYIDIKNRGDIVTRQLRFRILSGAYAPIKTEGMAAMTLLISSE
jgi:hypothetical protein